jgi:tetratricopeptide (TPR) repeat protein
VRDFALERLVAAGEDALIRRRHRDVFLELAESLDPVQHMAGIVALVPERNNLRAALRWSIDAEPAAAETLRLAYVLWRYWLETGSISEGWTWLEEGLDAGGGDATLRARALDAAGLVAAQRGDFPAALALNDQSREVAETIEGDQGVLGWVLSRRGQIEIDRGALADADVALDRALSIFRREEMPVAEAWTLIERGRASLVGGDTELAMARFQDAVTAGLRGDEHVAAAYAAALLGSARVFSGAVDDGLGELEVGLTDLREHAANFTLTIALLHGAPAYRLAGLAERERATVREAIQLSLDSGVVPRATACLEAAARLAVDAKRFGDAVRLWGAADRLVTKLGVTPTALRLSLRASVASAAHQALSPAEIERESQNGARLGIDEALDFALRVAST